jgi:hypothetical protein
MGRLGLLKSLLTNMTGESSVTGWITLLKYSNAVSFGVQDLEDIFSREVWFISPDLY